MFQAELLWIVHVGIYVVVMSFLDQAFVSHFLLVFLLFCIVSSYVVLLSQSRAHVQPQCLVRASRTDLDSRCMSVNLHVRTHVPHLIFPSRTHVLADIMFTESN